MFSSQEDTVNPYEIDAYFFDKAAQDHRKIVFFKPITDRACMLI